MKSIKLEENKKKKGIDNVEPQGKYIIDGETYACVACKRGHRVSKCTHGVSRPVSATNKPGRPSGGEQRDCQCPRKCGCTTKSCKHDRDCTCIKDMWLLAYIPGPGEGRYVKNRQVKTDFQGNQLSEDQVKEREMKREAREKAALLDSPIKKSSSSLSPPPSNCCGHKKALEQASIKPIKRPISPQPTKSGTGCTCGPNCNCAFCLDHPNNKRSRTIARQQFLHMTDRNQPIPISNTYFNGQDLSSCTGGQPQFALSKTPNPSADEFQQMFPDSQMNGGFTIRYPISQYNIMNTYQLPSTTSTFVSKQDSIPYNTNSIQPQQPDLTFDDGNWFSDTINEQNWNDFDEALNLNFEFGPGTVVQNDIPSTMIRSPIYETNDSQNFDINTIDHTTILPQLTTHTLQHNFDPHFIMNTSNNIEQNLELLPQHHYSNEINNYNSTTYIESSTIPPQKLILTNGKDMINKNTSL